MNTLHSLRCNQNGNIMYTVRNSVNKDEVKAGLLSYLSAGEHDNVALAKLTPDELAEMFDFTIEQHDAPYDDEI